MRVLVVVASNRAASGVYDDRSGPVAVQALRPVAEGTGGRVDGPVVVADGEPVEQALRDAIAEGYDVVVTSGGTGVSPHDRTPEMTLRVIERQVPGMAEAVRADGLRQGVPTAMLSRGVAGVVGATLIVNLPGSTGGVRDGVAVLAPVLAHVVDQLAGTDHAGRAERGGGTEA